MEFTPLRQKLYTIIFGTGTPAGKRFDMVLIYCILLSVLTMILESVASIDRHYGQWLLSVEWFFTGIFTVEYLVRIYCSPHPGRYIRSFYGLVDLLAILPSYLGLFMDDMNYLLMIRLLRVLRVFRILKLARYLTEANVLMRAMAMSRRKIFIFFSSVLVLSTIFGSLMFVVEGPEHGFTSIPKSIYWTIVTITTVGYGDITPQTVLGQMIASLAMLTGYSIIAVPTGILTAELANEMQRDRTSRRCEECTSVGHERDALYCRYCGSVLAD
ncbi:ion transporter [Pseudomaricurvus sp.]|uniref:ion transporter n=1 Tax=Pseudomaricurvus sp. TaxID=2004510 RepID=UPI003F6D30C6